MRYLREQYGLTREDLARRIKRSEGFIFKAEALTFPRYPVAFSSFYCSDRSDEIEGWDQQDKHLLQDAYRNQQRQHRVEFLKDWVPHPNWDHLTFRRGWMQRQETRLSGFSSTNNGLYPSQYALSNGLCVPAAHVHRYEGQDRISGAMVTALSDLAEYVVEGKLVAEYGDSAETLAIGNALLDMEKYYFKRLGGKK